MPITYDSGWPPISTPDLEEALAEFPVWLAAEIRDWVRVQENSGARFGSAVDAVQAATWPDV